MRAGAAEGCKLDDAYGESVLWDDAGRLDCTPVTRAIDVLEARYRLRLPDKLDQLAASLGDARRGSAVALEQFQVLVRRLYGSAGSYGLEATSRAARELEELLHPTSEPDWDEAERRLATLWLAAERER